MRLNIKNQTDNFSASLIHDRALARFAGTHPDFPNSTPQLFSFENYGMSWYEDSTASTSCRANNKNSINKHEKNREGLRLGAFHCCVTSELPPT